MQPTPQKTNQDPVQAAPATAPAQPEPAKAAAPQPAVPQPAKQQTTRSVAELAAAHERAHKRLTIIETVGVVLLVFLLLSGAAVWAYYQQESNAADQAPYSTNEYQ